jgi:murein L,D-transpeptidase YafK
VKPLLITFLYFSFALKIVSAQPNDFKNILETERVKPVNESKYDYLVALFASKGVKFPCDSIYLRAFKFNKVVEIWAHHADSGKCILINTYPICMLSGDLGPKREEGDQQIPEGFYSVSDINPFSKYFLSLGINYPNESDKVFGTPGKLGGEIYIHGGCETIGCLPMTDVLIKDIFLITLYAFISGQKEVPVHIYPTKLNSNNFNKLKNTYFKDHKKNIAFWSQLKTGYDYFEKTRKVPLFNIVDGNYFIIK